MSPGWKFTPYRPGDRARESQVEKFFKNDSSTRATAVIREGIQNSLDAEIEGVDTVRVRIRLGETTVESVTPFAANLFQHLNAAENKSKLHDPPLPNQPVKYLTFEDFNTRGLEGDPEQWQPTPGNKNPFFNFFRGEGVTEKSEGKRGRHGVGKMVFTVASRAHAIFGVTSTQDQPPLLMGTSTLWQHHLNGKPFHPDGWFGIAKRVDGNELIVPVREQTFISQFCKTFGLERESSPGLSIVVPWLDDGFSPADLLRAVIDGYFWPIIEGGLTVELIDDSKTKTINASTIESYAGELGDASEDVLGNLSLTRWALSLKGEQIPTSMPPADNAPKWEPEILPEELLARLQSELQNTGRTGLKVLTHVVPKGKKRAPTWFHVFISRDETCDEGSVRFIRRGLIIVEQRPKRVPAGFRALVIIEHDVLDKFLGDSENPAHTQWLPENVRAEYSSHSAAIAFVVNSVPEILRLLAGQQKKADPTLLLDLFHVPKRAPSPVQSKGRKPKEKPGGDPPDPPPPPPPPKPKRFHVAQHANGFVIARGDEGAERPTCLDIKAAYGVRRGNAFKKYRTADFRLDKAPITISLEGAKAISVNENRLVVEVLNDQFRIHVAGFDTNRDLHLDPRVRDEVPQDGETA